MPRRIGRHGWDRPCGSRRNNPQTPVITRFAPSPTGPLHLGHAFSALTVWKVAEDLGGTALLRIEDTDSTRVRPEHETAIYDDLRWLGLSWPMPVLRQSEHYPDYWKSLDRLAGMGLLYPCSCTRRQILAAGASGGADGMIYPGTCRERSMADATPKDAIRLDVQKSLAFLPGTLRYTDKDPVSMPTHVVRDTIGDPVLRRKDTGDPAYHLACVHDDARQEITHVVRGTDLQPLTPLHVVLQALLGFATPTYHHHALILDDTGKRLAKIDKSKALARYRSEGATPTDIHQMIGL